MRYTIHEFDKGWTFSEYIIIIVIVIVIVLEIISWALMK